MNDNQAKTYSTAAVWVSTALIFVFGVFRMNWEGILGGMFWALIALALAVALAAATQAIWNRSSSENNRKNETGEPRKS